MAVGGCLCGKVRVQYNGQAMILTLCHCTDCRKLTGSLFTCNFVVNPAELEITGDLKGLVKTSDSGNIVTNYVCSECGTPIYAQKKKTAGTPEDRVVLRAGILDDTELVNRHTPKAELFTGGRCSWISPAEGAGQFPGMLPSA